MAGCTPLICVVMAVHNGARYLPDQLKSLRDQTLQPAHLLVGDDASTDGSSAVISRFMATWDRCDLSLHPGPCRGYSANFTKLFAHVPEDANYIALSDQDDVWLPDKLARAVARIDQHAKAHQPVLYGCSSLICDVNLANPRPAVRHDQPLGFGHAIAQNFAGGNTMVLNRAAFELIRSAQPWTLDIPVHDWWLYQLISGAGGEIVYDPEPAIYYRQHDLNMIGANDSVAAMLHRIKGMLRGVYKDWNDRNIASLIACEALLTPDSRQLVREMADLGNRDMMQRLRFLRRHQIRRRGVVGTCGLWLSTALKRF